MSRWEIDRQALQRACLELGLHYSVRITPRRLRFKRGSYHGLGYAPPSRGRATDYPQHQIMLASNVSASQASASLWHELTHARQCERFLTDGRNVHQATEKFFGTYKHEAKAARVASRR